MFKEIFELAPSFTDTSIIILGFKFNLIEVACFMLFIGAMGKSAQLFSILGYPMLWKDLLPFLL